MKKGERIAEMEGSGSTASESEQAVEALRHFVTLVINQDHVAQGWLKFLITLQAGLVAGISYLFSIATGRPPWFVNLSAVGIPLIGILTTIALTLVTLQERKWQCWYAHQANSLPGATTLIFPVDYGCTGDIAEQHLDYISRVVILLAITLIMFWTIILWIGLRHLWL